MSKDSTFFYLIRALLSWLVILPITTFAQTAPDHSLPETSNGTSKRPVPSFNTSNERPLAPLNFDRLFELRASEDKCPAIWSEQRKEQVVGQLQEELKKIERDSEDALRTFRAQIRGQEMFQEGVDTRNTQGLRNVEATREIDAEIALKKSEQEAFYARIRESYQALSELRDIDRSAKFHEASLIEYQQALAAVEQGRVPEGTRLFMRDPELLKDAIARQRAALSEIPFYQSDLRRATESHAQLTAQKEALFKELQETLPARRIEILRSVGGVNDYGHEHPNRYERERYTTTQEESTTRIASLEKDIQTEEAQLNSEKKRITDKIAATRARSFDPSNIVIAFEGTSVYSPTAFRNMHYQRHRYPGALPPDEREELQNEIGKVARVSDDSAAPGLLSGHLFNVFEGGALGNPKHSIEEQKTIQNNEAFSDTEIFYFSESPILNSPDEDALLCLKKMYKPYLADDGTMKQPSLTVVGFSSGGKRAVEFAKLLEKAQASEFPGGKKPDIDLFVSVDSVEHGSYAGARAVGNALVRGLYSNDIKPRIEAWHGSKHFQLPNNVESSISFYQSTDEKGVAGIVSLRGSPVFPAAGENTPNHPTHHITLPADQQNAGHYYISQNTEVSRMIAEQYARVYKKDAAR